MRANEANNSGLLSATGNSASFTLGGGRYMLNAIWTSHSGATIQLGMVGADGSTVINLLASALSNNAVGEISLPPGTFQWVAGGTFGAGEKIIAAIARIPGE